MSNPFDNAGHGFSLQVMRHVDDYSGDHGGESDQYHVDAIVNTWRVNRALISIITVASPTPAHSRVINSCSINPPLIVINRYA